MGVLCLVLVTASCPVSSSIPRTHHLPPPPPHTQHNDTYTWPLPTRQEGSDDVLTLALFVQMMYEARFVMSRTWALTVWPRLAGAVISYCNRTATPSYDHNLALAKVNPMRRSPIGVMTDIARWALHR